MGDFCLHQLYRCLCEHNAALAIYTSQFHRDASLNVICEHKSANALPAFAKRRCKWGSFSGACPSFSGVRSTLDAFPGESVSGQCTRKLQPCGIAKNISFVGLFPAKFDVVAAKMAIGGCLLVNGFAQVEISDDGAGT